MGKTGINKFDGMIKTLIISSIIVIITIFLIIVTFNTLSILGHFPLNDTGSTPRQPFDYNYVAIILGCISLCVALSVAIPFIMSRLITEKDIDERVNHILNNEFKKEFNEELKEAISSLKKADADHSRMTASFLNQLNKPIWGIGWICRAMIRYMQYDDDHTKQGMYNKIIDSSILILMDCIENFVEKVKTTQGENFTDRLFIVFNVDNNEAKNYVIQRTFVDLVDFIIINKEYSNKKKIFPSLDERKHILQSFLSLTFRYLQTKKINNENLIAISWCKNDFENTISQYSIKELSDEEIFLRLNNELKKLHQMAI